MTSQPSGPNPYESDPYAPDGGGAPSQRPNPYAAQSHDSYYRPAADRYERRPERRRNIWKISGMVLRVLGMLLFMVPFFGFFGLFEHDPLRGPMNLMQWSMPGVGLMLVGQFLSARGK